MSESTATLDPSLYVPVPARVTAAKMISPTERLITLELDESRIEPYTAGQFFMLSLPGLGEVPISVCSPPQKYPSLTLCIRSAGKVTAMLHKVEVGGTIGLRGPMGNGLPLEELKGKDLLIVAGGLGIVPLRSLIDHVLLNRDDFKKVTILYGAKRPEDLLFREELLQWGGRADVVLAVAVNVADEDWMGHVGMITSLFPRITVDPATTAAIVVGPPVMYHFVMKEIAALKLRPEWTYLSLERRMKCGVGKCGHCQINHVTVCQDGPVFTYDQLSDLPEAL